MNGISIHREKSKRPREEEIARGREKLSAVIMIIVDFKMSLK